MDSVTTGVVFGAIIGLIELSKILAKAFTDKKSNGNGKQDKVVELLDAIDRKFDLAAQRTESWREIDSRHLSEMAADIRDLLGYMREPTSPGKRRDGF